MEANEQQPQDLAMLLYLQECPVGYNCLALDCIECLHIHMERGGENRERIQPA